MSARRTSVVHCKRESFDVYIGRPGRWGNPFRIGPDGTRSEVLEKFEAWIRAPERAELRAEVRRHLRGKVLGCWCAPKACHGDVLARIADEG
jgi:hypothetical protein